MRVLLPTVLLTVWRAGAVPPKKATAHDSDGGAGSIEWFPQDDFSQRVKDECGLDMNEIFQMQNKVMPHEVLAAVHSLQSMLRQMGLEMDPLRIRTATIESMMEGMNKAQLVLLHGELFRKFITIFGSVSEKHGFCAVAPMILMRTRMVMFGLETEGPDAFQRSMVSCDQLRKVLDNHLGQYSWDFADAAQHVEGIVAAIGAALRSDVRCLIGDIRDFQKMLDEVGLQQIRQMGLRRLTFTLDLAGVVGLMIAMDVERMSAAAEQAHRLIMASKGPPAQSGAGSSGTPQPPVRTHGGVNTNPGQSTNGFSQLMAKLHSVNSAKQGLGP